MEIHWGEAAQAYVTPLSNDEICVSLISRDSRMRLAGCLADLSRVGATFEPRRSQQRGARRRYGDAQVAPGLSGEHCVDWRRFR